jgi:hypothetical protein
MDDQNEQIACPIWGTPAEIISGQVGDGLKVASARAGGRYGISGTAISKIKEFNNIDKSILTTWIVEQRRLGTSLPIINTDTLDSIKSRRPLRLSEKKDRFIKSASSIGLGPGNWISISKTLSSDAQGYYQLLKISALIEATNLDEARGIVKLLEEDGILSTLNGRISITSKGLDRAESFETSGAETNQAFVAMWFDATMKEAWRTGFAPGIRDAGYEPFRIDGLEHNGKIDDAIVAEIKRSRFLIADFTCGGHEVDGIFNPNPRGGVYYEAGLAHGLGMEVIFTCRADRMPYLHFDTRQFAHIVWNEPEDLRESLYNRIAATLKEAPGAPGRGKGSTDPI